MKRGILTVLVIAGSLEMPSAVRAVNDGSGAVAPSPSDQPYESIWIRNVFDLKPEPPPAPPATETATPEPPPNVHLTGITTMFGKQAMFLVQEKGVPGKTTDKERPLTMKEGDVQGSLEVLQIDPVGRKVKIKVQGLESTVTFETNRPPSGPSGPVPGQPPPGMTAPNFTPHMPGAPGQFPPRQLRTPPGVVPQGAAFNPGANSGISPQAQNTVQPQYNGFGAGVGAGIAANTQQAAASSAPAMSAEEATALFAAQHLMHKDDPSFPPAPPPIAALIGQGQSGSQANGDSSTPTTPTPTTQQQSPALGTRSSGSLRGFVPPPPTPP